jgi:hypothetical protein
MGPNRPGFRTILIYFHVAVLNWEVHFCEQGHESWKLWHWKPARVFLMC